jgi:prepilin-type N-terminal cleavage/methylation domain-containing protein
VDAVGPTAFAILVGAFERSDMKLGRMKARQRQSGFGLIETMIVLAIVSMILFVVIPYAMGRQNDKTGEVEGQRVVNLLRCGIEKGRLVTALTTITLPVMINQGCFGDIPNITGLGTVGASATNSLTGEAYVVATVNLVGTNDGLTMATSTRRKNCAGVVNGAAVAGAARITVTPSGGAAVVVKAVNDVAVDIASTGLATACGGAEPIAITIAMAK